MWRRFAGRRAAAVAGTGAGRGLVASTVAIALLDVRWPATLAILVGVALVLYTVAVTREGGRRIAALILGLVVTGGAVAVGAGLHTSVVVRGPRPVAPSADIVAQIGFGSLLLGIAWTVGVAVRQQRAYAVSAAEQAARQALADERQRIARELHDIVAHGMSLIAVKAGVANHVAEARPQEANEALRQIEATSRAALADLRRVLGVLRADTSPPDLHPTPDLAGLAALGDWAVVAGVRVDLTVDDPAELADGHVPHGVQLSAYRIVQEALTNVVKHADAVACRVVVTVAPDEVRIEVTDDGRGAKPAGVGPGAGHGLVGMRERVATYGGSFTAGHRSGGGFAVQATLPYQSTSS